MVTGTNIEQYVYPVRIVDSYNVQEAELLFEQPPLCASLTDKAVTRLAGKGAYIVLDFGKELHGGIRLISGNTNEEADVHIRFGESLTEACTPLGVNNAGNDHSPRDFTVRHTFLSDMTYGQTGFRFVRLEVTNEASLPLRAVAAVLRITEFPQTGHVVTDDPLLNDILETAAYTLQLNCQNGYIWDGIKRDRLIWAGDLNPEVLTAGYRFGAIANVPQALTRLREDTPTGTWMNTIPTYSAWWVISLLDYYHISGDADYLNANRDYAREIFALFNRNVTEDGQMQNMWFFLDWQTCDTPDATIGTAVLIALAAKRYRELEANADCDALIIKLQRYLDMPCASKQVRAFQILAGGTIDGAAAFLEKDGAHGISTFMSYYVLTANYLAGGTATLDMLKSYFGGMLSRGATTFWEDFDLDWLEGSGRIDELPPAGVRDLHADYGKYCYTQLRHSLCHAWSCGAYAFAVERILGVTFKDGRVVSVKPDLMGLHNVTADIPTADGMLHIEADGQQVTYKIV